VWTGTQDAAVTAQLLVRAEAIRVERDQAELAGTVAGSERSGDLRRRRRLADAGRADQREDAAAQLDRFVGRRRAQVLLEHLRRPFTFVAGVDTKALGHLAHQERRKAAVEQLLRETSFRRPALQLFHERERAEALLDQLLDGAQLGEKRLLALQGSGGVDVHRRGCDGRRLRDRLALRGCDVGGDDLVGEADVEARRRCDAARRGLCGRCRRSRSRRARGRALDVRGSVRRRRRRCRGKRRLTPLEHAGADVILERQRAHRQPLGIVGGTRRRQQRSRLGRSRLGRHRLETADRLRRHRDDLDATGARPGRDHDGIVAERLADEA